VAGERERKKECCEGKSILRYNVFIFLSVRSSLNVLHTPTYINQHKKSVYVRNARNGERENQTSLRGGSMKEERKKIISITQQDVDVDFFMVLKVKRGEGCFCEWRFQKTFPSISSKSQLLENSSHFIFHSHHSSASLSLQNSSRYFFSSFLASFSSSSMRFWKNLSRAISNFFSNFASSQPSKSPSIAQCIGFSFGLCMRYLPLDA
jgi:hypothetical protein